MKPDERIQLALGPLIRELTLPLRIARRPRRATFHFYFDFDNAEIWPSRASALVIDYQVDYSRKDRRK